jgi:hypothetical protein
MLLASVVTMRGIDLRVARVLGFDVLLLRADELIR